MKKFWSVIVLCTIILVIVWRIKLPHSLVEEKNTASPIPAQFTEKSFFLTPIIQATSTPVTNLVTGIVVPHHLLARDMIADIFARVKGQQYDRIIVMSPDHFWLGTTTISVSDRGFSTIFGVLETDHDIVRRLINVSHVSSADFFYREHGIQAELPFIAYYFPHTPIVAVSIKENATKAELDPVVEMFEKILTKKTLIIQSTDFSHYLPVDVADTKDAETIAVLKANDPEKILSLSQPDHMDSVAAEYIQMRLQKEFFKSDLTIINHRNSQYYTDEPIAETTSYITQMYMVD